MRIEIVDVRTAEIGRSAEYCVDRQTPCLSALSLSTRRTVAGTAGKVWPHVRELGTLARLGDELEDVLGEEFIFPAALPRSIMLKPPAALIPGIAGGDTAITRASEMPANLLSSRRGSRPRSGLRCGRPTACTR